MRSWVACTVGWRTLGALCVGFASAPRTTDAQSFRLEQVAPGVHAAIRTEGSGNIVNGNSTVIVGARSITVVDATSNPAAARELIAAIRRISPLPVSHLVITHWHGDHSLGAQAFARAWPGIEIVAHPSTREDMLVRGAKNRAEYHASLPGTIAFLQKRVDTGRGLDDSTLTAPERALLLGDIAVARRYLAQVPGLVVTPPTLTVTDRITLHDGRREIVIRHIARGNTAGDLVVILPTERVVAAGDLVVHPTPYAFDSYLDEWVASIDTIRALRPVAVVPGHGPVLRDDGYLALLSATFHELLAQADSVLRRGVPVDSAASKVDVSRHEHAFATDRARRQLWRFHFAGAAGRLAVEAATRHRG